MNSDQLMKFKTVVECGTLSKAAERLYISQPALSYTIATLEKEIECTLFTREKNKLVLTPDGQELLAYATQVSDMLSRTELAMRNRKKINLSSNNIAATILLDNIPDSMLGNIRLVQAGEEQFPRLLLNGTLDAATCDDYYMQDLLQKHPGLELEKHLVFEEFLGILVPRDNALFLRETILYEDLRNVPLCVQADVPSLMLWLENIEKISGIPFDIEYPFDHITLEHVQHRLSCPEIRRSTRFFPSPELKKAVEGGSRFIPIRDSYSTRNIYLWNLKEKHRKIKPLLNSLESFFQKATK